jgi:hypothetical protein
MFIDSKYRDDINIWISKFKYKLSLNQYETANYYIVNKEIIDNEQGIGHFNKLLLIKYNRRYMVNPEKNFLIIDQQNWLKIKSDNHCEKEIIVKGSFTNKKYVFEINPYLYYFYFLNDDDYDIQEGYLMFGDCKIRDVILFKFYELEIKDFLKEMKIQKIYEIQKIYYQYQGQRPSFLIKIKKEEGKYANYDVNFDIKDNSVKIFHHYFNGEMLKKKKKKKLLNRQLQQKEKLNKLLIIQLKIFT